MLWFLQTLFGVNLWYNSIKGAKMGLPSNESNILDAQNVINFLMKVKNPLSIEEIAALQANVQNIIANRLQQVAH